MDARRACCMLLVLCKVFVIFNVRPYDILGGPQSREEEFEVDSSSQGGTLFFHQLPSQAKPIKNAAVKNICCDTHTGDV